MRAWLVAAVVVTGALATGCGVQPDAQPRALATGDVPYGLLAEGPNIVVPPTTTPTPKDSVTVYFLAGERLRSTPRLVTAPVGVRRVLDALVDEPPDEQEATQGLRTAITPDTSVSVTGMEGGTVTVDLSPEFAFGSRQEQVNALAQIVFTLTELPEVTGVRFTLDGVAVEVPTPAGLVAGPVTRDAFPAHAPQPLPPNPPQ